MYLLLTDVLTCPRCGPEFGLILLADRIDERRVVEGRLGCPNCRNQYPIRGGVVDVRLPGTEPAPGTESPDDAVAVEPEAAVRLAALMGLANASGTALLVGPGAALAPVVASLADELEVVALTAEAAEMPADPPVTRIVGGPSLPFRDRALRGVALTAGAGHALLAEAVRAAQPGAHVVVERAAPGTGERLAALGARVLLEQEGTVVAAVHGQPVQLRMNAVR
jgi:uncharacterized protein YbaR (Trm112 family)